MKITHPAVTTRAPAPTPCAGIVHAHPVGDPCGACSARGICWSRQQHGRDIAPFDSPQPVHSRIKRGGYLYRANADLIYLYAIHSGSVKSSIVDAAGREQVVGYYHGHGLLGLEGIDSGKHVCNVVALEDTEVCKIPFATLQKLGCLLPDLQNNLHRLMGHEIVRSYEAMQALMRPGSLARVAAFLLRLSKCHAQNGDSGTHLKLLLTRREIASLLGLEHETVCRAFGRLRDAEMIAVYCREIEITSRERLRTLM